MGGSNSLGQGGGSSGSNGTGTGGVFIGIGGSSNSGGSTGTGGGGGAGGSGFVGAGGSSGASGSSFLGLGGTVASDAAGGTGGSAGGGSDFDGPVSMGLQVAYHSSSAGQVQFDIEVTNTGSDLPVINTLKLRYYFSDESFTSSGSSVIFDAAAWNGPAMPYYTDFKATCSATLTMLQTTANPSATSYYEFGCNSMATIGPSDKYSLTFRSPTQGEDVTNDYSYVAADGSAKVSDPHLVIYQGTSVVWGVPPP